jgi:hypothetical protein
MQATSFAKEQEQSQAEATEYVVAEPRAEEDGVDWCAWWAEYAANLE